LWVVQLPKRIKKATTENKFSFIVNFLCMKQGICANILKDH
jgi:hypothetical protein